MDISMATYNIDYAVGYFGSINIDVECDTPRDDPNFMFNLLEKADIIVRDAINTSSIARLYE